MTPLKQWIISIEDIGPPCKAVLHALADHARGLGCQVSNSRLQKATAFKERAIRNALRELEAKGLISTDERWGEASAYRILMPASTAISAFSAEEATASTPASRAPLAPAPDADSPRRVVPPPAAPDADPPAFRAAPPAPDAPKLSTNILPTLSLSPPISPDKPASARSGRRSGDGEPEGFAEWYAIYPRHVDRQGAAKAFPAACRKAGGREALMRLTKAHRFNPEPQFIPHPSTWLRNARWLDQPLAPPDASASDTAAPGHSPLPEEVGGVNVSKMVQDIDEEFLEVSLNCGATRRIKLSESYPDFARVVVEAMLKGAKGRLHIRPVVQSAARDFARKNELPRRLGWWRQEFERQVTEGKLVA